MLPDGMVHLLFSGPNIIVICIVVTCNFKIILYSRQMFRQILPDNTASRKFLRRQTKIAKMLLIVTLLLIISYMPMMLFGTFVLGMDNSTSKKLVLYRICTFFVYFNSLVNPLLYYKMSPSIRRAYRKLFTRQPNELSHSSMMS